MVKAMKAKIGNPVRKLVLIKLADHANDKGECWPSYQYIADQCEIDRSTVRRHIKKLVEDGHISLENRKGPKGNSSNMYRVMIAPVGTESTDVGTPPTGVGTESTPPVGTESTRTNHSLESVSEPVKEPSKPRVKNLDDSYFERLWSTFDVNMGEKGSKKNALAQWKKLNPDQQLFDEIMAGLIAQIRQKEMQQAAGVFCPNFKHVERWIKDRRWEDEISNRIVKPADTRDKAARAADEAFGPDSEPGFYEGDFARIDQDGFVE